MTADSEFNLWSSGCFNRTADASPFTRGSYQSFGLLDLQASGDQLFSSADAANAAELLAALQQQQQHGVDEQNIDAQIEQLLQMKQALHRHRQQSPQPTVPIFEDEPLLVARSANSSLTMQSSASSASLCQPPMSLEFSLPLDSNKYLSPMPSSTLDINLANQEWAWATGAAAAAHAAQQPVRHSIDLGGMAHHMGALDLTAANNSFAQQQSVAAATAAVAASAAASAAAALATTQSPFLAAALAPVASSNRHSIDVLAAQAAANRQSMDILAASRQSIDLLAANRQSIDLRASSRPSMDLCAAGCSPVDLQACSLSPANLALHSSLYMPAASSGLVPCAHQNAAVPPAGLNRPASRIPTGRMSLDVTACSSLYNNAAAPLGVGRQQQQAMTLAGQQNALAFAGVSSSRASGNISSNQRASMDVPLSRTPDVRCPPRKSCSLTSSSSTSPTGTSRQQGPFAAGGGDTGAAQRSGRQQPMHQAPKWAGSHWHPMAEVVKTGQIQNKGTGVFIPPGMKVADEEKPVEGNHTAEPAGKPADKGE